MNIHIYGEDSRLKYCQSYLEKHGSFAVKELILLPVPSSKDKKTVLGTNILLEDIAGSFADKDGCVPVCYGKYPALSSSFPQVIDLSEDEEYLAENAHLTSHATVGLLLTEEKRAPEDMRIGIIGYGRIGQCLAKTLIFLGARVTVFTTKAQTASRLCALGICGIHLKGDRGAREDFADLDVLINTAPAKLIPDDADLYLSDTRVLELASGINIPPTVSSTALPSLPSKFYPASAGEAMGRAVIKGLCALAGKKGRSL